MHHFSGESLQIGFQVFERCLNFARVSKLLQSFAEAADRRHRISDHPPFRLHLFRRAS